LKEDDHTNDRRATAAKQAHRPEVARLSENRLVKIATLWQRKSAKGKTYFSGFMGDVQLLMFDGGRQPHPTKPDEQIHIWRLFVQQRDPNRRPKSAPEGGAS
jgi:hypothetical protein